MFQFVYNLLCLFINDIANFTISSIFIDKTTHQETSEATREEKKKAFEDLLGPPTQPPKHPERPSKEKCHGRYVQPR